MSMPREDFSPDGPISTRPSKMPPTPLSEDVRGRLSRVIGTARAQTIIEATLKQLGLQDIVTPQDMFAVATVLESHGGPVAVVAAALKMRAVLRGAVAG